MFEAKSGNLIVQLGVVTEPLNRHWYERNNAMKTTIEVSDALSAARKRRRRCVAARSRIWSRKDYGLYSRLHADHSGAGISPN